MPEPASEEQVTITQWRNTLDAQVRFSGGGVHEVDNWPGELDDAEPYSLPAAPAEAAGDPAQVLVDHLTTPAIAGEISRIRKRDGHRIGLFRVEGDRTFQQIPWELLLARSSGIEDVVHRDAVVIRSPKDRMHRISRDDREQLRVLLVVGRPSVDDVSARNVADLTGKGKQVFAADRAHVDVLRLGTWAAFEKKARSGRYDIIHFDLHGAVHNGDFYLVFERPPDDMLRDSFEGDPVSVEKVKETLIGGVVQVAVLNACESASRTDNLAERLVHPLHQGTPGVPAAIGMRHQLTVETARAFSIELYEALADTRNELQPLTAALRSVREKLGEDRRPDDASSADESLLPSLFIGETPRLRTTGVDDSERRDRMNSRARYVAPHANGVPVPSLRSREERFIRFYAFGDYDTDGRRERKSHQNANAVLVRGLHGSGKTTLATSIAVEWDRLNYVDRTVVVDLEQLLAIDDATDRLHEALREQLATMWSAAAGVNEPTIWSDQIGAGGETLFFLDGVDIVDRAATPRVAAALREVLREACEAANYVLMTARTEPAWLNPSGFSPELPHNRWYLTGLSEDDAATLFCRSAGERVRRLRSYETEFLLRHTDMLPILVQSFAKNAVGDGARQLDVLLQNRCADPGSNPLRLEWHWHDVELGGRHLTTNEVASFEMFVGEPRVVAKEQLEGFLHMVHEDAATELVRFLEATGLLSRTAVRPPGADEGFVQCWYIHPILALWGWEAAAYDSVRLDTDARDEFFRSVRRVSTRFAWPTEVEALLESGR